MRLCAVLSFLTQLFIFVFNHSSDPLLRKPDYKSTLNKFVRVAAFTFVDSLGILERCEKELDMSRVDVIMAACEIAVLISDTLGEGISPDILKEKDLYIAKDEDDDNDGETFKTGDVIEAQKKDGNNERTK